MIQPIFRGLSLAVMFALSPCYADAPFLSPMFSENMVLQRDQPGAVWGWAKPGEKVAVTLAGQSASAVAAADGKWRAQLPPLPAGGPHVMTVKGHEERTLNNILIGDVWLCSGQSNMGFTVGASNRAAEEIAAANFPEIRLLKIPNTTAAVPQPTFDGAGWKVCTPQSVGGFSAVGYFFGRKLHQDLKVPIGLINSSWGGTIAEAWTSRQALAPLKDFNQAMEDLESRAKAAAPSAAPEQWYVTHDAGSAEGKAPWAAADLDDSAWPMMNQPQEWSASGVAELANFDGVVWFRRSLEIPADAAGKVARLHLGAIDDEDTVWLNGTRIGATEGFAKSRVYPIPAGLLKPGANTLAVRVLDASYGGGFSGPADQMKLELAGIKPLPLTAGWHYHIGADLKKTAAFPKRVGDNPNVPTVLYNAMISPLLPFGIKGAIWYQGESNAARAAQYRKLLPALIGDWRKQFGQGDFPFYIVQLANFTNKRPDPGDSDWAELREAQALTAKNTPNCGLAVAIDIGAANDIHPKNKQEVGRRLALEALAKTYGKDVVSSGPVFKAAKREDGGLRLSFDHLGGGLSARGGALKGFAIAGEDKKFVWADAKIEGETVSVSSPQVPAPVAVRYAWEHNPDATLFNQAGLPAVPFRSDDWPGLTEGRK